MAYIGGCQCGRTRYRAEGPPSAASLCYCRMCQKASGQPFMVFVRFAAEAVVWSSPPAVFASSSVAERGFCAACGTPLTYREPAGPNLSVTMNSLDDPGAVEPMVAFAVERKAPWLDRLGEIPAETMDLTGEPGFVSHQRGDGADP